MAKHSVGERELVATSKGARLTYLLMLRGSLSVERAACVLECSVGHVYKIVDKISLAGVPIVLDSGEIRIYAEMADFPY